MKRIATALLGLVILGCSMSAQAQQTIVDPSRSIDWRNVGVPGGIPNRTTVCATLNAGATAAQINSAISACPSGQVVKLNAGTYNLSTGILMNKNNVTLRGAGPDQTFLNFSGSNACSGLGGDICIEGNNTSYLGGPAHSVNWTAGYAKGNTTLTLSSTSGLSVGMLLYLDQLNDSNSDTGSVWICSAANVCVDEGGGAAARPGRAQNQIVKVTAINGSSVTITPGLYMPNWRSSQSPQAFFGNTTADHVEGTGVEDLSMDHGNSDGGTGIYFLYSYGCWAKNVRSLNGLRSHVWVYESAHDTIRDSYFYGTKNAASQSYGVETFFSSDTLVENNIFQHITGPITINGSASGSVIAYNYMIDDYYNVSANWMIPSMIAHEAGIDSILTEGNEGIGLEGDNIHGTHHFITAFRNYLIGWETGKTNNTPVVNLYAFSRFFNIIGNVLGKAGYHNNYEWASSGGANKQTSIFSLGDPGNLSSSFFDPLVKSTLFRWGNYDVVTGTVQWNNSEVPTGLSSFSNPLPPDHTLPGSFYLPGKPAWFGVTAWPPIGPDVTGGPGPGGHSYKIPARQCYENSPKVGSILTFNANTCYAGGGAAPTAPTNLRIIGG